MKHFNFLTLEDVLLFHNEEMKIAGEKSTIRNKKGLLAAIEAPKALMVNFL